VNQNRAEHTADPSRPNPPEEPVTELQTLTAAAPAVVPVDEQLSDAAAARVRRSVPAGTRRAYSGDWARFTAWCSSTGRVPLPTTPATLAEYATALADASRAPSTVDRALAAIATAHRTAGVERPDTGLVRAVLRDHRRQRAEAKQTQVRKAEPVTVPRLRLMVATCDGTTDAGLRDRALLVLGFALGARRAELVAVDIDTDLIWTPEGLVVVIRTSKTDKESAGRSVALPYGSNPNTCPVRTVRALVDRLAVLGHTSGPLFRRIDRHGVLGRAPSGRGAVDGRISGQAVALIVAKAAVAAGLDPEACWSGHSLRRGFATEAYAAGADPLRIARHGGWRDGSSTLLGYIEEVERWKANPLVGVGL
jgi:site-specific recombinase XerD